MKASFHNPEMPEDMEVEVCGVLLVNGGDSVELTEDDEARYFANHGEDLKDALLRNQFMRVGNERGKVTYLDAEGVEVEPEEAVIAPEPTHGLDEVSDDSPEKEGD